MILARHNSVQDGAAQARVGLGTCAGADAADANLAPDIILVIGDFLQFMAIRAIYDQRTSGRRSAFYPCSSEIGSEF